MKFISRKTLPKKNFYGKKEKGRKKGGETTTGGETPQSGKEKSGQTQTPIISKSARANGALLFSEKFHRPAVKSTP